MGSGDLRSTLRGIIPPMATPLLDSDTLDRAGLERLIEHILSARVSGLFILGSTGEAPALSHRLQRELIERTCAQVRGRVPVLVGISDTSIAESLKLSRYAADAGAAAVVLAPPYYYPASQEELLGYVRRLTARLPLPVFLYNMPALTKVAFDAETVARAAEITGVVGFKDSSGDFEYFQEVLHLVAGRTDFAVFMGPEELLAQAVRAGADGGVCGGANIWPGLYVDLYAAVKAGRREDAAILQEKLLQLGSAVYRINENASSYLRGLKCALAVLGICSGVMAEPYEALEEQDAGNIRKVLAELGLLSHAREMAGR